MQKIGWVSRWVCVALDCCPQILTTRFLIILQILNVSYTHIEVKTCFYFFFLSFFFLSSKAIYFSCFYFSQYVSYMKMIFESIQCVIYFFKIVNRQPNRFLLAKINMERVVDLMVFTSRILLSVTRTLREFYLAPHFCVMAFM